LRGSQILQEDDNESGDVMFFTPPESPSQLDPGFEDPAFVQLGDSSGLGFSLAFFLASERHFALVPRR